MTKMSEERITRLEAWFPQLAKRAVAEAFARSLASGQKVLIAEGGVLYEVTKDGRREVKRLPKARKAKAGKAFRIS